MSNPGPSSSSTQNVRATGWADDAGYSIIGPDGQAIGYPGVGTVAGLVANDQTAALANAAKIQKQLTAQGVVQILTPGVVYITGGSLVIPSWTRLYVGQNTRIVQADNTEGPMLVNSNWRSPVVTLSSISDAATSPVLNGRRLVTGTTATAHGLTVNDGVLIRGDTSRQYNGVYVINSTPSATTFTFYASKKTAIGSGTGTMTAEPANIGIEVTGGAWDFNGRVNQSAYTWAAMLFLFSKTGYLHIHDVSLQNATKYDVYCINSDNALIENINVNSSSDGIHLHAFTQNATIRCISGESGDDFIAYTANNTGYTQYDFLNSNGTDSMSAGGDCIGLTIRDIKPDRCGEGVVSIYPVGSLALESVVVDTFGSDADSANAILTIAQGGVGAPAATAVKDITVRNIRGIGRANTIVIGRSTDTVGVTIDKLDISGIYPNGTFAKAGGVVAMTRPTINKCILEPRSKITYDITAAMYFIQTDTNTTITDLTIADYESATTGSGASHSVSAITGTLTTVKFVRPRLFGTSQLFSGTPLGSPNISISDWYTDTYRLAWINFNCRLSVKGGRANAPGGNIPITVYGTGITADLIAYNNDWGSATNWLQIGTAAGDTPTCNLYMGGHASNAGIGSGILWTATAPTVRLRASDGSLPVDGAKFTSFGVGAIFYNNNAAYGVPGVGLYAMGAAATTRIAA